MIMLLISLFKKFNAKLKSKASGTELELRNRALVFHGEGRFNDAKKLYEEIINKYPNNYEAIYLKATVETQLGNYNYALELFDQALALNNTEPHAFSNQGIALAEIGRFEDAVISYDHAILLNPNFAEAYSNRSAVYAKMGRHNDALCDAARAIQINPGYADAYINYANSCQELGKLEEALVYFKKVIALNYNLELTHFRCAIIFFNINKYAEALADFDRVIELNQNNAAAHLGRGKCLRQMRHFEEALNSFENSIKITPNSFDAYQQRGVVLMSLNFLDEAIVSYDKAIELNPSCGDAYCNRGLAFMALRKYTEAIESCEKALELQDFDQNYRILILYLRMLVCDWPGILEYLSNPEAQTFVGAKFVVPFPVLALVDDPDLQLSVATLFSDAKYPAQENSKIYLHKESSKKIRIGYYSSDFYEHATSYLIAELFELHDSDKFEIFGFYFGDEHEDESYARISQSFDHFFNVTHSTDIEIVNISRELGIDIAIDLKGFTKDARTGIFSERCAPVQVNYLGYPGTMGASYMDYIVADETIIPKENQKFYSEKIAYMPDSYQINCSKRKISADIFSRKYEGLPEDGFIFCCFNNNYKILPATFDIWMRLLKSVEGSVLWLLEDNSIAAKNLREEAQIRGIDPSRLIFAPRVEVSVHLARQRLADLFLDTWPCNAHTTASDALRVGLPVLTLLGKSFAARVGGSLLNALGLPELIARTQEEYETKAIELATNSCYFESIKKKLLNNQMSYPLFNAKLFTVHLEAIYVAMHERYQSGQLPEHLYISH
jgi:predicted O-linked N-acetylglucosamine transferase (SPINDLY family)